MNDVETLPLGSGFGLIVTFDKRHLLELVGVPALLKEHGCLLFRGFPADLDQFKAFSARHSHDFSNYEGGAFRIGSLNREQIGNDPTVLSTTGHTQGFPISLHGEMHYLQNPPEVLWFYCQRPPSKNGQTTICHGRMLWQALKPETRDFFQANRIRYDRVLEDGDWQTTFGGDTLDKVAEVCSAQGMTWSHCSQDSSVTTSYECSAVTDDGCFVNNVLPVYDGEWAFESGWMKEHMADLGAKAKPPLMVRTADGARLPQEIVDDLRRAAELETIDVEWQTGDIVMVDNLRVMHGRRKATDPQRSILVRLGALS